MISLLIFFLKPLKKIEPDKLFHDTSGAELFSDYRRVLWEAALRTAYYAIWEKSVRGCFLKL